MCVCDYGCGRSLQAERTRSSCPVRHCAVPLNPSLAISEPNVQYANVVRLQMAPKRFLGGGLEQRLGIKVGAPAQIRQMGRLGAPAAARTCVLEFFGV